MLSCFFIFETCSLLLCREERQRESKESTALYEEDGFLEEQTCPLHTRVLVHGGLSGVPEDS
jgi:hypothetical protein